MRIAVLTLCLAASLAAQKMHPGTEGHNPHEHRTAKEWVEILEQPGRDDWQKPAEVVEALELEPGVDIADIGAGTGYFSVPFAERVGPQGKVFAVDVQQDLIDYLTARAKAENIENMQAVLGKFDDPLLAESSVDLIFICDVVHHIDNRQAYFAKLAKALREGGRIAIIDFYKKDQPVGPNKESKIAKDDMIAELGQAGFRLAREQDFLALPVLPGLRALNRRLDGACGRHEKAAQHRAHDHDSHEIIGRLADLPSPRDLPPDRLARNRS